MRRTGPRLIVAFAVALAALVSACTSGTPARRTSAAPIISPAPAAPASTATSTPSSTPSSTRPTPSRTRVSSTARPAPVSKRVAAKVATASSSAAVRPRGSSLPLRFATGDARQVLTVVAASTTSTEGTLQAWRKVSTGWRRVGGAVPAWLGSEGLTRQPSETRSATPIGSFTLTHAFGREADPGTALPYLRTTPDDWWISQAGPLYNTHQRCASGCSFTQGDPNEHLYYETPYYRYAVVIDYNTRNAPGGVTQGAGSAFFLHVTVGEPTQGCVSIDEGSLVTIMQWLTPARHPRILIGIG